MEFPQEIDNYIKESIDHTLGLPVSEQTLQLKLLATEESLQRVQNQCSVLLSKIEEKDEIIARTRAESTMNAQAMKRFVEENRRVADECMRLSNECNRLKRELKLYDQDRDALMDFGNEADERARVAEIRVQELDVELGKALEELNSYKQRCETRGVDSLVESSALEENLLESILTALVSKDDFMPGHTFLEANRGHESCQLLLKMWDSLKPSTQVVLSLAAEFKKIEKAKEHLKVNLDRAEEEVNLLFGQNKILDAENKRLLKQIVRERNLNDSGGKQTSSASAKTNKRKSNAKMSSPIEKKIDIDLDAAARQPLSPLPF